MEEWGLTRDYAAAQCDDQMLAGNGAAPRVWGAGVWPLASTRQTQAAAIFCNTSAAADNPHHVISVLQTLNNYLPSRLSSPGTTLAGGASARYSGQLMLSFYYLTFRQK